MSTVNLKTLSTADTDYSADSVEWCPHEPYQNIFVCGTYQLLENENQNTVMKNDLPHKRLGKMLLYKFSIEQNLVLLQTQLTSAILDQKWCHIKINGNALLGIVNADGFLQIYELIDGNSLKLFVEICVNVEFEDNLALSLDWNTGRNENQAPNIIVSDSKGYITVFNLNSDSLDLKCRFHGHEFEAWIGAFDYWDPNIIYTGGDDCKFKTYDLRCEASINVSSHHNGGVTSIHSNKLHQFYLATGSYDENLLLWDTRQRKSPLSALNLNGGVWRLKWDPFTCKSLLAACMYNGFHVISCENLREKPLVLAEYHEHESIAYGADWSYLNLNVGDNTSHSKSINRLLAICSFYDHKLSVLKLDAE